jgi:multidrug efflux pump subunit AcrA (membrane-fusion protein)
LRADAGIQELGLPPWFALFFFRLRRLRARFDMITPRRQKWPRPRRWRLPGWGQPLKCVMVRGSGWMGLSGEARGGVLMAEIRAEMVGTVLQVVAEPGTALAAGDTVVILESMKMELPAVSEKAGTLTSLAVAKGDRVQQGDVLGTVE